MRALLRVVLSVALAGGIVVAAPVAAQAAPVLTVAPNPAMPGSTVTVSGSGFGANERVSLYFDTTLLQFVASSGTGAFGPIAVTVPAGASSATHYVSGEGAHSGLFAQAPLTVTVDWPQAGFDDAGRHANPYETTLSTGNVANLEQVWSQSVSNFSNYVAFVVYQNVVYSSTISGAVNAFDAATGQLLWHATITSDLPAPSPVAFNGRVFLVDGADVVAFTARCRTNGAVCAPAWRHTMSSAPSAGLVVHGAKLYVPLADGTVHLLNPATGAETVAPVGASSTAGATTAVAFGVNGGFTYGQGTRVYYHYPCCDGTFGYGGYLNSIAATSGKFVMMTSDGMMHAFGTNTSWNTTVDPGGCSSPVAVGANIVIGGGCTQFGAYAVGDGSTRWALSAQGDGAAIANGVAYVCAGGQLKAYHLSYGSLLWTGGACSGPPVVTNGTLFSSGVGDVSAYRLNGLPTLVPRPTAAELG